ncbi:NAD(P)-binding protein [Lepidopterella palustris CBS 459.81]|uniref:NAD(P)-binding protein n=1 Tax=Lepidopterella palustris CBS 459.81 TaxID=1314670 RepID=A0A8E2E2D2_9PEZI|nr:NAD(P)-binding protein [Lepidopterella palustris CBS 459.81]
MNIGKKSVSFKPERDIPPLDGKVILVTGGNIGLGKQCVLEYARHRPAQIWLATRNLDKAKAAVEGIQKQLPSPAPIKLLEMDLSSLESVKKAASTFSAESDRLDILMLNAGIMAAPPGLTKDGYELQFGTNYVGHALLAKLLLPVLEKTASGPGADVRIIMLSSHGHMYAPKPEGIRFDTLKTKADALGPYGRYGQSKLAMILWVRQMAKLYPQFTLSSIHPGVVRTNLMNNATGSPLVIRILGKIANRVVTPVDQGARNQLWASVAKDVKSGEYYEPVGIGGTATDHGKDEDLAKELWGWTEKELEGYAT